MRAWTVQVCCAVAAVCGALQAGAAEYVWWEAEAATATNFPAKHPFEAYTPQEKDALSGGRWIGVAGEPERKEAAFAEYSVNVPKDGSYDLYVRKFWKHGPFRWRFGSQPWAEVGKDPVLLDGVDIRKFVGVNWIKAGTVTLKAGAQPFRVELTENKGGGCFDCFLLIQGPFTARGKMKPGEKYNRAPDGWFPFEPDSDPFAASPIDLRHLNESVAGEQGFIRAQGDGFVHGNTGRPVRFWAVNGGTHGGPEASAQMARYLAKLGVNMVRLHGAVWDEKTLAPDPKKIAHLHEQAAAFKKEGIYTYLSIYFPVWCTLRPEHGYEGYTGQQSFAMPYFNPKFQAQMKEWLKAVLTTVNPHTGKAFVDDPAVAVIELTNEDSLFFWTFNESKIPAPQMELFEKQFAAFAKERHGSIESALQKWNGEKLKRDNPGEGRLGFVPLWNMANQRSPRAQDTAEFMTLTQKRFYETLTAYVKNELKFKACVVGSNWVTADPRVLGPLDKYSNTVCDFMDRHGYYGGPHKGDRAGFSINKGDQYNDASGLKFEGGDEKKKGPEFSLPIFDLQYNGKPSTISEINWTPPNRFRAEFPLLCAA